MENNENNKIINQNNKIIDKYVLTTDEYYYFNLSKNEVAFVENGLIDINVLKTERWKEDKDNQIIRVKRYYKHEEIREKLKGLSDDELKVYIYMTKQATRQSDSGIYPKLDKIARLLSSDMKTYNFKDVSNLLWNLVKNKLLYFNLKTNKKTNKEYKIYYPIESERNKIKPKPDNNNDNCGGDNLDGLF